MLPTGNNIVVVLSWWKTTTTSIAAAATHSFLHMYTHCHHHRSFECYSIPLSSTFGNPESFLWESNYTTSKGIFLCGGRSSSVAIAAALLCVLATARILYHRAALRANGIYFSIQKPTNVRRRRCRWFHDSELRPPFMRSSEVIASR